MTYAAADFTADEIRAARAIWESVVDAIRVSGFTADEVRTMGAMLSEVANEAVTGVSERTGMDPKRLTAAVNAAMRGAI